MKILVIDDEPIERMDFEQNLRRHGHEVWVAANGLVALGLLEERKFDIITLDLCMPLIDGMEFLQRGAERSLVNCPVVLVSAYAQIDIRGLPHVVGQITKPVDNLSQALAPFAPGKEK